MDSLAVEVEEAAHYDNIRAVYWIQYNKALTIKLFGIFHKPERLIEDKNRGFDC